MKQNKTIQEYPDILDAKDIAEYLNIGYVKALNLVKYGNIPYLKIGNTYRINKLKFQEWLNIDVPMNISL